MRMLISAFALWLTAWPAPAEPLRIPAPGGEVILPTAADRRAYDLMRYAAARRVGDTLYVSGVIVHRAEGEGRDVAAFETQVRRAFDILARTLKASGAGFEQVAMINSFHVWVGPDFTGSKQQQFAAFSRVAGEYLQAPYPAWTAVGTSGTLGETGIAEIQLIVHAPARKP